MTLIRSIIAMLTIIIILLTLQPLLKEKNVGMEEFCSDNENEFCYSIRLKVLEATKLAKKESDKAHPLQPVLRTEIRPIIAHEDYLTCGQGSVISGFIRQHTFFDRPISLYKICEEITTNKVYISEVKKLCEWDINCYLY